MSSKGHGPASLFAKLIARFARKPRTARKTSLILEDLEERCVPATFTPSPAVADGGTGSLRADINQANTNAATSNTINLKAGTYTLSLGELQVDKSGATFIFDGAGPGKTIIKAADAARVFEVYNNSTVIFENLTIEGGTATNGGISGGTDSLGGGILSEGSNVTLNNVVVTGNTVIGNAGSAGGFGTGAFATNGGDADGGGIYSTGGSLLIEGASKITNNQTRGGVGGLGGTSDGYGQSGGAGGNAQGGGLFATTTSVTIKSSTISGNTVTGGVGGNGGSGAFFATGGGGGDGGSGIGAGFFALSATLTIQSSTVSTNLAVGGTGGNGGNGGSPGEGTGLPGGTGGGGGAGQGGGGAIISSGETATISNSTIAENAVHGGTGGVGGTGGTATSGGSGGSGGSAGSNQGGGLYVYSGTVNLRNATVAFNGVGTSIAGAGGSGGEGGGSGTNGSNGAPGGFAGSQGGGAFNDPAGGAIFTVVSTLIADNAVASGTGSADPDVSGAFTDANGGYNFIGNVGDATGFTSATDLFGNPIISALGNFGGPTQTIALMNGSPAINKGSNPDNLKNDQRGANFSRVVGGAADIGAYEVQSGMCGCMNMGMTSYVDIFGIPPPGRLPSMKRF